MSKHPNLKRIACGVAFIPNYFAQFVRFAIWRAFRVIGQRKVNITSELNVDNWNDNCEAKSEAKSPRPLRSLQVDFSLLRGQIII